MSLDVLSQVGSVNRHAISFVLLGPGVFCYVTYVVSLMFLLYGFTELHSTSDIVSAYLFNNRKACILCILKYNKVCAQFKIKKL